MSQISNILPIYFEVSRRELIKLTAIGIAFVLMAVLFLVRPFWFDAPIWFVMGIGAVSLIFFGACLAVLIRLWWYQGSYLTISEQGVVDNSINGLGLIAWQDIDSVELVYDYSVSMIALYLHNPHDYISSVGRWRQWLFHYNHRRHGTPVLISSVLLAVETHEICADIRACLLLFK